MPFFDSLDIANRALQHVGAPQILSVTEDSKRNTEASFAYDKVRRAELRRNVWRFSIRKAVLRAVDTTTMILAPTLYSATTTYLPGSIVTDANGQLWTSLTPDNVGSTPGGNNDVWDMYFGPLAVSLHDSDETYSAGELVYKLGATAGDYTTYLSLQSDNSDAPDTATAWDATVTYGSDAVVSYSGSQWRSLLPLNLNVTPADPPAAFSLTTTYSIGQTVTASDQFIYSSVGGSNLGQDPTTDGGVHWTRGLAAGWSRTPTLVVSSTKWLPLITAVKQLALLYPIGSGPSSQNTTRNVFRLPSGFLREAPQDPKAGSNSYLGAASGLSYNDWEYEGDYIVSSETGPILYRFVADVTKVSAMDDMFCEGLALRIALALCEPVTQSNTKLQTIASEYKLMMGDARTVNAIEMGAVEPPIDDYVAVRA